MLTSILLLVQVPKVQTFLSQNIASYLSEELQTTVTVGAVDIDFFNSLILEDFYIEDKRNDTLIYAKSLRADISLVDFENKKLHVDELSLSGANVELEIFEGDSSNSMQFLFAYFNRSRDTLQHKRNWLLDFNTLSLNSSSFSFHDYNYPKDSVGIDFKHIDIKNINGSFSGTRILDGVVKTSIQQLAFDEKSGFSVNSFSSNAVFSPKKILFEDLQIETDQSKIRSDLVFQMENYADFQNFVDEVHIDAQFSGTSLHSSDLAYFAPDLIGLDLPVQIKGKISGTIANLSGDHVEMRILNNTFFEGDFDIRGLPNYNQSAIYVDVEHLTSNAFDLQGFNLPPFDGSNILQIPPNIFKLGQVNFQGKLSGFYNDLVAYGHFDTRLGNFETDISIKKDESEVFSYDGKLSTKSFDLGEFLEIEKMGGVSLSAEISGTGLKKEELEMQMDGRIQSLLYNNYKYKNIIISGNIANNKFLGDFEVNDDNLLVDFSGMIDASGQKPIMDFTANVEKARLAELNLFHRKDSLTQLSMRVEMNLVGQTLDEVEGQILLNDIHYTDRKRDYLFEKIKLVSRNMDGNRTMSLHSDLLDAEVKGSYELEKLDESLKELANLYIPSVNYELDEKVDNNFEFSIEFKQTEAITELFMPNLSFGQTGVLTGSFVSSGNQLLLNGFFPELSIASLDFREVAIEGKNNRDSLQLDFKAGSVSLADSSLFQNVELDFTTYFNTLKTSVRWDNQSKKLNEAEINIETAFNGFDNFSMIFYNSYLAVADSVWEINGNNEVQVFKDQVNFYNFNLSSGSQKIHISGKLARDSAAALVALVENIDLGYLSSVVPEDIADVEGFLDGKIIIQDYYTSAVADLDLEFSGMQVNQIPIGHSKVKSFWDSKTKSMKLSANVGSLDSSILNISGMIYPYATEQNLDLKVLVDSFPIAILSPYIDDYLSNISGSISGLMSVKGSYKDPLLSGKFDLDSAKMTVNYLNTTYTVNDGFFVEEDLIGFNLISIIDMYGNEAIATGSIFHDDYTDFNLDIGLEMDNFLALNTGTSDNDLYFGKAVVSGLANISGFADQLIFDINITTEDGTNFNIPLDRGLEVSSTNFLTFTNSDTIIAQTEDYEVDLTGIQLNFDLQMTPDAEVSLIFDEKIGDVMKANGSGNLKLEINTLGDFNIYGQYVVEQGEYLFTLQNVINKKFEIEKGGRISWNGSPYDAIIDIDAVYSLRASLYDILVDTAGSYKRRIPVDLELMMTGKLLNPDIEFDIDVPTADDRARQALQSILYLNPSQVNRQEMNQQVFGLLVLNRFLPPTGAGQVNEDYERTNIGAQSSSEFLSNQLSNWLSTLSEDVDIGIRYRPGDELSSDEVELELSTEILSDRVILDGNFGYSNNEYNIRNQNNSGLIGEFSIEYKISKDGRLRVRGFNRSNNNSLLYTNSPYTQGFGVFYREEFNHLGELWRKWWQKDFEEEERKE